MLTTAALEATKVPIETKHIQWNDALVAEFVDYLRWMADQDTGTKLTSGQVWELYYEVVCLGRYWIEVCEDLELPVRTDWN